MHYGQPSIRRQQSWDADARLIHGAAQGDTSAQCELWRQALPVARRTARCLLGRSQDLDDAIQASLLAVLRSAPRFHGRSSLNTWVTRITTRTTLRLVQKQRGLVPLEAVEVVYTPESVTARGEELPRKVWEYLEQLPELQRQAIVLRHGLDYSVGDIAEATESSPNTVKYRLKEALAKMRRLVRRDLAVERAVTTEVGTPTIPAGSSSFGLTAK